eukprot:15482828-Alexandrium_andersonii.AAC.1
MVFHVCSWLTSHNGSTTAAQTMPDAVFACRARLLAVLSTHIGLRPKAPTTARRSPWPSDRPHCGAKHA